MWSTPRCVYGPNPIRIFYSLRRRNIGTPRVLLESAVGAAIVRAPDAVRRPFLQPLLLGPCCFRNVLGLQHAVRLPFCQWCKFQLRIKDQRLVIVVVKRKGRTLTSAREFKSEHEFILNDTYGSVHKLLRMFQVIFRRLWEDSNGIQSIYMIAGTSRMTLEATVYHV